MLYRLDQRAYFLVLSLTVVFGLFLTVDCFTKRPLIAERPRLPELCRYRPCWANVRPEGSSDPRKGGQQDMAARKSIPACLLRAR